MLKLRSLRSLLEQAVPDLKRDPQRLLVMGDNGRLSVTGTVGMSFEYRYTAYITVLDYTGHADALMVPVLAWLKINQPEATQDAVRFAINPIDGNAVDIGIEVDLTERAIVKAQPEHPTRLTITHPPEPALVGLSSFADESVTQTDPPAVPPADSPDVPPADPQTSPQAKQAEQWELWFDGQKLAEWELLPPAFSKVFNL